MSRHMQLLLSGMAIRHEMKLARETQQLLVPKNPPRIRGIDAVGWSMTASLTGGDCFDLWKTADGQLGILLADSSGNGLGAAMRVAQTRGLVRILSEVEPDPHRLLKRVNSRLCEDLGPGHFVTAFVAFLSPAGLLRWSSAGQGPVFARTSPTAAPVTLDPPVQPLGVMPTWRARAPRPVQLDSAGVLLLASDGIFEAFNPAGERLGEARMRAVLAPHLNEPAADVLARLREDVRTWGGDEPPTDDQTIVVVRRN